MKLSRDIQSLSVFKRDTAKFMRQMKKTKEPIVLTVNGKAAMVVHDASTYEDFVRERERNEVIAAIRRGREDAKSGREQDAEEFFEEFFKKNDIPYNE
jgi:prevent-host-death family protein